jgi:hypothetical protein
METAAGYHGNRMIRLAVVLTCLTMISLWRLAGLSARFATGANGGDLARVAKFEVDGNIKEGGTGNIVVAPGSSSGDTSFTVRVTNNSEVAVRYKFTLENEGNLPLILTTTDKKVVRTTDPGQVWKTIDVVFPGTTDYKFSATWDESQNDYRYSVGVQNIKITVTAEQED